MPASGDWTTAMELSQTYTYRNMFGHLVSRNRLLHAVSSFSLGDDRNTGRGRSCQSNVLIRIDLLDCRQISPNWVIVVICVDSRSEQHRSALHQYVFLIKLPMAARQPASRSQLAILPGNGLDWIPITHSSMDCPGLHPALPLSS